MYFKKLDIFGFKSFADKTVLNFEPGITAIVGPNGCGKSNIFDAIRWVLGEQSIKELRGSVKEDVIFNGTDKKPGLGFAEVSLTFSNESKMLPIAYDEVTVTRRLFRSGESEYLLNKTQVRLKDIVELFMGTGIGAESYSLVQQGKVDLVVSAKPEDRRMILDEASGVTKYKAKRKEALNKLKDTENNLLRINDIVVEVKRQISSIERQAKKAHRYKDEFEKLKKMEVRLAKHELSHFDSKRQHMQAHLAELKAKEEALTAQLTGWNDLLIRENGLLEELENKINEVNGEDIKIDGQLDIHNRQIGFNEERIENIGLNEKRIEENKEKFLKQCHMHHEKIEEVNLGLAALDETVEKNQQDLADRKNHLGAIAGSVKEAQAAIQYEEHEVLEITSNQVNVKNRLTEIMKEVQGSLARKRRLEMENVKVTGEKEETDCKLTDIAAKIASSKERVDGLQNSLADRNQALCEQITQLSSLEYTVDTLGNKKLFLRSQKDFIEKLCVQYQDIPDPVVTGRLLTDTRPLDHHTGIIGKVKDVRSCAFAKYEIVCETKFIELDPKQLSVQIEQLSKEIEEKTARKDEFIVAVKEQRRLICQAEFDIQEEEKILSIYESQKKDVAGESDKLTEELELVSSELEETRCFLNALKTEESDAGRQLDRLNQDFELSRLKIKEKQDVISLKAEEREEISVEIAQLEAEISSLEDKKDDYSENMRMFTEAMNNNLEEIKRLENENTELMNKKEQFAKDSEACREKMIQIREKKASLRDVGEEYTRQKDGIVRKIDSTRADITAHSSEAEEIKNTIHDQQFSEQKVGFKEKEIRDRLWQTYKLDLNDIRVEESQEAGVPREEGAASVVEEGNPKEWQAEIERLRKRCDSFGSVNLVAIEEFDELRERFEFLTKQQSDLMTAKETLHQTIRKINRQTRQMFMDTFTRVSEEFRIYFRMLFGGGDAQLVLLDPENVLESGIEIIARPPGKKLQNISLLSGGEKSLTAIALIFGVFKVNPSPFCVLDEIDAALDESNTGRFSYLLKDFAKIAQFIIITHSKKTIANADVMYGITMQETGISKLVSVKFADSKQKPPQRQEDLVGV